MKFHSIFVIFLVLCKVTSFSRGLKYKALQTAFINISESLAQRNYLVAIIVVDSDSGNKSDSLSFVSTIGIPHIITKFDIKKKSFRINSSAIVSLNTIASLETFHDCIILPATFTI